MNLKGNYGIYTISNEVTGDCYVGSTTVSFHNRRRDHFKNLRKGTHHSRKLQNAFNKYGEASFKFNPIECLDLEDVIPSLEQYWINMISPKYNMTLSVNMKGFKHSENTKLKISRVQGGRDFEVYKEGVRVGVYRTQRECAEYLGLRQSKISMCLLGKNNTHKGYKFKYVGEDFNFTPKAEKYWKSMVGIKRPLGTYAGKKVVDLDNQVCFYSVEDARKFHGIKRSKFDKILKNPKKYGLNIKEVKNG